MMLPASVLHSSFTCSVKFCGASSPRSIILSPAAITKHLLRVTLCLCASVVLLSFISISANAQRIATLQLTTKGTEKYLIPVQTNLDAITFVADSVLQLTEITGGRKVMIPYQIETGNGRVMHWLVQPSKNKKRVFELSKTAVIRPTPVMQANLIDGELVLSAGKKSLLQYNYKTVYPPKGVDTAYKRSGFIHPLNTPNGQSLTRIQAPDHYHHYGLWNPWTRVLFEKDTVDFWNLKDRKGTVRFSGFGGVYAGDVFSGYTALHDHIAFQKNGIEKIAINEIQTIKIYDPGGNSNYYFMDFTVQLSCASSSPVKLLEYRYGGIGVRATELWDRNNSMTLTSEGKDRKGADGSTARWCLAQGQLGNDYGGLVMMSYPANYNHPEPLRVWPESANNRGDVFINFSPTKNKDWLLEPGKSYILKYRFLIFNDKIAGPEAEEVWQNFAKPPLIWILNNGGTKAQRSAK